MTEAQAKCLACEHRAWGKFSPDAVGFVLTCGKDGVNVAVHQQANYCPIGAFGCTTKPDGWDENPALAAVRSTEPEIPVELLTDEERRGLGDVIEAGIKAVKLDVLAKAWAKVTGLPCGCEARKQWLNRLGEWLRQDEAKT